MAIFSKPFSFGKKTKGKNSRVQRVQKRNLSETGRICKPVLKWCPIKMRKFHWNESCLLCSLLAPKKRSTGVRMAASRKLSYLMKNYHFNRTLQYISVKSGDIWSDVVLSTTVHFLLRYMKPKKEDKINNRAKWQKNPHF